MGLKRPIQLQEVIKNDKKKQKKKKNNKKKQKKNNKKTIAEMTGASLVQSMLRACEFFKSLVPYVPCIF